MSDLLTTLTRARRELEESPSQGQKILEAFESPVRAESLLIEALLVLLRNSFCREQRHELVHFIGALVADLSRQEETVPA